MVGSGAVVFARALYITSTMGDQSRGSFPLFTLTRNFRVRCTSAWMREEEGRGKEAKEDECACYIMRNPREQVEMVPVAV